MPFNRVMVATFFLTGMDISYRLINWFDQIDLDWERAMVIVAGRVGRPTSGVTATATALPEPSTPRHGDGCRQQTC